MVSHNLAAGSHATTAKNAAVLLQVRSICLYHLPIAGGVGSGRIDTPLSLYFYYAESAGADGGQPFHITQGGDIYVVGKADFENCITLFTFHLLAVYGQGYLFSLAHRSTPPLLLRGL